MRPSFALPLALVLALLLVAPASAGGPVVYQGIYDFETRLEPVLCPGIDVVDHEVGTYRETYYFDNQGNVVRMQGHYNGTDNLYNTAHPDFVLTGDLHLSLVLDPLTGQGTYTGLDGHITVPGAGALMIEAGLMSGNIETGEISRMVGRHTWRSDNPEVMAQLCSLLAGD